MTDSLRNRLLAAEARNIDQPALWIEDRRLSYGEVFSLARSLAALMDEKIPPSFPVGIFCQRDLISLVGILAAALSGRPYVPLNPGFPRERLASVVAIARPSGLLCSDETRAAAGDMLAHFPVARASFDPSGFATLDFGSSVAEPPPPAMERREPAAYMMFTSGTTGVPKGVCVSEQNLLAYLDGIAPVADIGPGCRATHFFDLSFDLSVHDVFVTWMSGAELCVLPKALSMSVAEFARNRRVSHWFSVPSLAAFCDQLGQLTPGALPDLRNALFCGEALAVTVMRRFRKAAPRARLWNVYGPTEATIAFTAYEVAEPDGLDGMAVVPIGRPIGQEQVRLEALDDPPRPGAAELCLGGRQVTPGYMNNPQETARRFFESDGLRWYRTGDVVEPSDTHGLCFLGRIDDQVKINGYRVELFEIDAALREAAETSEVAALPWPVSAEGHADQIVGFVVNSNVSQADIRRRCRLRLPAYMVPRKIIGLDRVPILASGKIDRRALRNMLDKSQD